jgi:hypothetical protein
MLGPGGEVGGGVAIPVNDELAGTAVKGPLRQLHPLLLGSTPRAGPTRGVPAVTNHEVCAEPSGFIPELTGKFRPCGVADGPSKAVVADEVVDGKVLDSQPGVVLDQLARDLVEEGAAGIRYVSMFACKPSGGLDTLARSILSSRQGARTTL